MLLDDIGSLISAVPAHMTEKNGLYSFEFTIAERKAFLSVRKLVYKGAFRLDETKKELRFSEMLKESGSGLSSGIDGISPGFGFKVETYKTGAGPREGGITEQSALFGKQYRYSFDYSRIRKNIEDKAVSAGYSFHYQIALMR